MATTAAAMRSAPPEIPRMLNHPALSSASPLPGFFNIISLLLVPQEAAVRELADSPAASLAPSPQTGQSQSANVQTSSGQAANSQTSNPRTANAQTANAPTTNAMIRSMFSSSGNFASAIVPSQATGRSAADAKSQAGSNAQASFAQLSSGAQPTEPFFLTTLAPVVSAPAPKIVPRSASDSKSQTASQAQPDAQATKVFSLMPIPRASNALAPMETTPAPQIATAGVPQAAALPGAEPKTPPTAFPNSKSQATSNAQPSATSQPANGSSLIRIPRAVTAPASPTDLVRAPGIAAAPTSATASPASETPVPSAIPVLSPMPTPSPNRIGRAIASPETAVPDSNAQAALNGQPSSYSQPTDASALTRIPLALTAPAPLIGVARALGPVAAGPLPRAAQDPSASKLPFGAVVYLRTSKEPVGTSKDLAAAPAALAFGLRLSPADIPESPGSAPQTSQPFAAQRTPALATPAISQEFSQSPALFQSPAPQIPPDNPPDANQAVSNPGDSSQGETTQLDTNPGGAPRSATTELKSYQDAEARIEIQAGAITAATVITDGSSNNPAGEFAREFPAPNTAPLQDVGKIQAAPQPSAGETVRASEPAAPASSAQPWAPAQQVSVRIAPPQGSAVDIQMMERGGQVHVAVRTADGELETSLRQDLGTLMNSLERSGFRTEIFTPREALPQIAAGAQTNSQNSREESPSGSGGRGGNFGDSSQNPSQNASQNSPGNPGGGQQQRRSREQRSQKWIEHWRN